MRTHGNGVVIATDLSMREWAVDDAFDRADA